MVACASLRCLKNENLDRSFDRPRRQFVLSPEPAYILNLQRLQFGSATFEQSVTTPGQWWLRGTVPQFQALCNWFTDSQDGHIVAGIQRAGPIFDL